MCFRSGVCAALLSLDKTLAGIMITASHNPACDNGVKLVDSNGSILPKFWEERCSELVNSKNFYEDIVDMIEHLGLNTDIANS